MTTCPFCKSPLELLTYSRAPRTYSINCTAGRCLFRVGLKTEEIIEDAMTHWVSDKPYHGHVMSGRMVRGNKA